MSDNQQPAVSAVAAAHDAGLMMGFHNLASFEFMQRVAKGFALSTMVPPAYQAVISKGYGNNQKWEQNPAALSNCMVALDLAQRMGASPLQVMQNLHVIEGRPSWSSPFIIALINNSGLYAHNLRFTFEWLGEVDAVHISYEWVNNVKTEVPKTIRVRNARCVAWTKDKSGELVESPEVTIEMAVAEGWYTRNGSKWRTMTQLMCQYRAAAFFGRTHNPELLMGLPTADEIHDIIDVMPQADGTYAMPPAAEAAAASPAPAAEADRPAPRAPRAKAKAEVSDAAGVKEVAPAAAAEPAPAAVPVAEAEPTPAAVVAEPTPEPAAKPGIDMETGEVLPEPIKTSEPTPAEPAKAPAKAEAKHVAAPPLSAAKIAFVKAQLDTTGGWTTDDFVAQFGIAPAALTVQQFPEVLAWFKTKPVSA